jgi:hypothetical protein
MVKHEIKVELKETNSLQEIIEKSYFEEGFGGKLTGKKHYISITQEDDINWTIFNGLHNATVKIVCEEQRSAFI